MKIKGDANLDLKMLDKIIKRVDDTQDYEGRFGVIDDEGNINKTPHPKGGGSIHKIALVNHNGDPNNMLKGHLAPIPPRPFFYTKAKEKGKEWKQALTYGVLKPIFTRETFSVKMSLTKLSRDFARDIKISVIQWDNPDNSEYTKEQKGFNNPLIETGTLRDSIKGVVKKV